MDEGLKVGDIVYLRSGSVALTVAEDQDNDDEVKVYWFNGEFNEEYLAAGTLTKTKPNQ